MSQKQLGPHTKNQTIQRRQQLLLVKKMEDIPEQEKFEDEEDAELSGEELGEDEDEQTTEGNLEAPNASASTSVKSPDDDRNNPMNVHQRDKNQKQDYLMQQNLEKIGVENLNPLTPEVISRQATINVGTIGHVAHGKSTVVKSISSVRTIRFKNEIVRNITIKLGYANAKLYKCSNEECPRPDCYCSRGSAHPDEFPCERPECSGKMKLIRHISFVDVNTFLLYIFLTLILLTQNSPLMSKKSTLITSKYNKKKTNNSVRVTIF